MERRGAQGDRPRVRVTGLATLLSRKPQQCWFSPRGFLCLRGGGAASLLRRLDDAERLPHEFGVWVTLAVFGYCNNSCGDHFAQAASPHDPAQRSLVTDPVEQSRGVQD